MEALLFVSACRTADNCRRYTFRLVISGIISNSEEHCALSLGFREIMIPGL